MIRNASSIQFQALVSQIGDYFVSGAKGEAFGLFGGRDGLRETAGFGIGGVQRAEEPRFFEIGELTGALGQIDGLGAVTQFRTWIGGK